MNPIDRAIEAVGSQANLARAINVLSQHITNWRERGIPADRCPSIEAASGVRCEELRPDLTWNRDESGQVTGYTVTVQAA
jgi:DNA-binding transcriptional regulator YdaS (Cro superfamily)